MSAVIPGEYRVFAWDEVENGAWQDPEFLRVYEELGTPVHIDDGGTADVTVALLSSH